VINLIDCVEKYKNDGFDEIYANAKVCQDVILTYIFKSRYKNYITIKGGIVMFNLTNNLRLETIFKGIENSYYYEVEENL